MIFNVQVLSLWLMILYKYLPPERIDVLTKLKIRFSQPATYNDPFELRPITNSDITEEQFRNIMPILIRFHGGTKEVIDGIKKITYPDFLKKPSYVLWLIQQVMASGSLALCLTEIPNSLLMWAHYAGFHKGFVIGFDASHEFFTNAKGTYYPIGITYQTERPIVKIPNPDPVGTYFTKSIEWAYEKEWRVFRRLPAGKSPEQFIEKDIDGFPIYLFDLPVNSINEIVVGCRSTLTLKKVIKEFVAEKAQHVNMKESILSQNKYELYFV